jgi:hypothetical protein
MISQQYVAVAAGFLGVCGIGLLAHGGALTVPTQERAALTGARAAVHAELERREGVMPAGRPQADSLCNALVHIVETELAAGHIDAAVRAWHDAYGAALESRSWESMIAVGDAFMKIGRAAGTPDGARMNARDAYLAALIRARRDRSVDGALRSAQAFAGLGDRAIVEQSFYIAAQLAAGDEQTQQRVREAQRRWAEPQTAAEF